MHPPILLQILRFQPARVCPQTPGKPDATLYRPACLLPASASNNSMLPMIGLVQQLTVTIRTSRVHVVVFPQLQFGLNCSMLLAAVQFEVYSLHVLQLLTMQDSTGQGAPG